MNPARSAARRKPRRVRAAAVVAGGLLAAAASGLAAGPASADGGPAMELSSDGIHFSSSREPVVFPNLSGMVPGDFRRGTVWVRNAGTAPAEISLAVTSARGNAVLTQALELAAGSHGGPAATVPLAAPGGCRSVFHGLALAPGQTARLELALGLDASATNATRRENAAFGLLFLMQEAGAGATIQACHAPDGTAARTTLPQLAGTSGTAVEAGTAPAAHEAAGAPSGVGHQEDPAPAPAPHSNVVGNDQRPGQLLLLAGGLFCAAALAKRRRRNP
ncbi:hypothetical protein [Arthrobacter sp. STN4]|uniref:hypothetical protein n=1 Tax=Arthrobacter sp. STN4 TaxID=2923276 RepID=UPI00211A1805|nr:hypothetical protein [Arthrobacter sp. STN4]MCQ9163343.1 hypothetical protein [Arthrobacter sp. STN4]